MTLPWLSLPAACQALRDNQLIVYPTEAVFGLGSACTPQALKRLQQQKPRPAHRAWILVVPTLTCIESWLAPRSKCIEQQIQEHWPGPVTLLLPASDQAPAQLCQEGTLALRISSHPVVHMLTQHWQGPLVSTSANPPGQEAARTAEQAYHYFTDQVAGYIPGQVDLSAQPSQIIDARQGLRLR